MKKKVIRLSENDLNKIVKRVLIESEKSELEKIKDLKRDLMDAFRNVSMPEFEKGKSTEKSPKLSQIIDNIKDILNNY
jgi:hypothetical protein